VGVRGSAQGRPKRAASIFFSNPYESRAPHRVKKASISGTFWHPGGQECPGTVALTIS